MSKLKFFALFFCLVALVAPWIQISQMYELTAIPHYDLMMWNFMLTYLQVVLSVVIMVYLFLRVRVVQLVKPVVSSEPDFSQIPPGEVADVPGVDMELSVAESQQKVKAEIGKYTRLLSEPGDYPEATAAKPKKEEPKKEAVEAPPEWKNRRFE